MSGWTPQWRAVAAANWTQDVPTGMVRFYDVGVDGHIERSEAFDLLQHVVTGETWLIPANSPACPPLHECKKFSTFAEAQTFANAVHLLTS